MESLQQEPSRKGCECTVTGTGGRCQPEAEDMHTPPVPCRDQVPDHMEMEAMHAEEQPLTRANARAYGPSQGRALALAGM